MISVVTLATLVAAFSASAFAEPSSPDVVARDEDLAARPLGTAIGGALDPTITRPPETGNRPEAAAAKGPLTINIVNKVGKPVSIYYGSNAGGPPPIGNPTRGSLASSTRVLFPSGWAGRIGFGADFNPQGSKFEGSYVANGGYRPDIDVSFVDGFTYPGSCSCQGVTVSGCNKRLFEISSCPNGSKGPNGICYNPKQNVPAGPPSAFFAPCRGAAYTYPQDDKANSFGQCDSGTINCCIGHSCPAPARQPAKKRSIIGRRAAGAAEDSE